jgi:methylenetetrahydrofolate reductase (NADPH)
VPIVPGILPLTNFSHAAKMAKSGGVSIPDAVRAQFDGLDDDPQARHDTATKVALGQCRELYALGIRQFHFYTLNRAELVLDICRELGSITKQDQYLG